MQEKLKNDEKPKHPLIFFAMAFISFFLTVFTGTILIWIVDKFSPGENVLGAMLMCNIFLGNLVILYWMQRWIKLQEKAKNQPTEMLKKKEG